MKNSCSSDNRHGNTDHCEFKCPKCGGELEQEWIILNDVFGGGWDWLTAHCPTCDFTGQLETKTCIDVDYYGNEVYTQSRPPHFYCPECEQEVFLVDWDGTGLDEDFLRKENSCRCGYHGGLGTYTEWTVLGWNWIRYDKEGNIICRNDDK